MLYAEKKKKGICHLCGSRAIYGRAYCGRCGKERAKNARIGRLGRTRQCIGCGKEIVRFRRRTLCDDCAKSTGERYRDNQREWRQKLKREVFEAYGGAICICCGEREFSFLSVDHIENNGADHRRELNPKYGTGGARFYGWLKRSRFPKGFQVLCMNCQWGKKLNAGICPHKEK